MRSKTNSIPKMRFTQADKKEEADDPDTTVVDIKFPNEENSFMSVRKYFNSFNYFNLVKWLKRSRVKKN